MGNIQFRKSLEVSYMKRFDHPIPSLPLTTHRAYTMLIFMIKIYHILSNNTKALKAIQIIAASICALFFEYNLHCLEQINKVQPNRPVADVP